MDRLWSIFPCQQEDSKERMMPLLKTFDLIKLFLCVPKTKP